MMKWNIDPDHSVAAFVVEHMTLARVRGQFNRLSGTICWSSADMSDLTLDLQVDVTGIYTGIPKRDDHLRSLDFFDVATCPVIMFKSTGIVLEGGKKARLTGMLSLHGVSREVSLQTSFSGPLTTPEDLGGETTLGMSARTVINREDFGMMWNVPLPGGAVMVGREIEILLDIEADREEQG